MREREIEAYLVQRVRDYGGEVRKLRWIGRRGAPDRIVFLNGAHFVELKAPGRKLESHQVREHGLMNLHDISVHTIDCKEGVDWFMQRIAG